MKKFIAIAAVAVLSVWAVPSQAGILIEPFFAYETGDMTVGSVSADAAGTTFGARLGGTTLGFMYGFEYSAGTLTVDGTPDTDFDVTDMGVFVGYEFPVMIRAFATYMFKSTADAGSEIEGSGMRFGVGFTGLPFVSINIEKIMRTYDDASGVTLNPEWEFDTTVLSVSLPLP